MKSKFAYLEKDHVAKVAEHEVREDLGAHEVLVRMLGNNLCTTDYQHWMGLREHQGYPMAGGHEGESIVEKVGSAVNNVKVGDKVGICNYAPCGKCENCRNGNTFACTGRDPKHHHIPDEEGFLGGYGMSEYRIVDDEFLYVMNPDLEPCEAGFLEPIATVCSGIEMLRLKPHETVLVIGAGTMGLANAQVAQAFGGRVAISELMENKVETARKMGFAVCKSDEEDIEKFTEEFTGGKGFDCVILAVSNKFVIDQAQTLIKRIGGRILFFAAGYPAPETVLKANDIHYRRIELIGTMGANTRDFQTSAMLLNTHAIDVKPMCEPVQFELDDIQAAFEAASTPGMYRVHVKITEE